MMSREEQRGARRWVALLAARLDSRDEATYSETVRQIAELGPDAVPAILRHASGRSLNPFVRDGLYSAVVQIGQPAIPALLAALGVSSTRDLAARALAHYGGDPARSAFRRMLVGYAARRKKQRSYLVALTVAVALVSLARFPLILAHDQQLEVGGIVLQFVTVLLSMWVAWDTTSEARKHAAKSITSGTAEDRDALILCLQDQDEDVRKAASDCLLPVLTNIRASDAPSMSRDGIDSLIKSLGGKNRDLSLAILKALEQIGDKRALPVVEKLAAGKKRGKDEIVRKAAEECLPALRERAERSRQANLLLRPASDTGDDTLVRPAGGNLDEMALLVRAAGEEG